jgi:ketosteroid isomerase-like protein
MTGGNAAGNEWERSHGNMEILPGQVTDVNVAGIRYDHERARTIRVPHERGCTMAATDADETLATVASFNDAFNRHDVDAIMALMTADCVFENTAPAPDGERHEGQAAVRAVWEELFGSTPSARFAAEESFAAGDRCVVRWRYTWDGGHVRGVDVIRVRDGKVAEKLSYVKG